MLRKLVRTKFQSGLMVELEQAMMYSEHYLVALTLSGLVDQSFGLLIVKDKKESKTS